ncbi:DMT family transporter [Thermobacillus sp.]|uniref:DMT family transporter n=1 Tax=Thermobacillus sp. TaxID=2108467 RepID=UPI00257B2C7C|nr:DMT family transporter [Thermobacillus sp.]
MSAAAVLLVVASGFLHAVWNLLTKRSGDKKTFLWAAQSVSALLYLPWTWHDLARTELTASGWFFLLLSVLLHGLYMHLLAAAYEAGDLSQVYPIMRGTSPLLVPLAGVLLLGEPLTLRGWLGVLAIIAGIALLSEASPRPGAMARSRKALLLALAVGLAISAYIVVDKIALNHVTPVVLIEVTNIGNALVLLPAVLRSGRVKAEVRQHKWTMLLGGALMPSGYLLFLFALSLAPVAVLAPMREIGTVFGAALGISVLKEKGGARRLLASCLITAGVIILGIAG